MKYNIKLAIFAILLVAAMSAIIKAVDWLIPSPPVTVNVCIEDYKGKHDCTEYRLGDEVEE